MEFTGGAEVRPVSGRLKDWLSFSQSYLPHRPVQAPKIVKGDLSTVFSTPSVDISPRLQCGNPAFNLAELPPQRLKRAGWMRAGLVFSPDGDL